MTSFKVKWFHKWAEKEDLTDNVLQKAIQEMEQDLTFTILNSIFY